jgi:CheY-like chemotaxis protein
LNIAEHASGDKRVIRILSASIDPGLNHSRALLLRHYGFDVTTSESKEHARQQIEDLHFDVLIFGNTLPEDTCWELAQVFRRHNSNGKIIEILPSQWAAPKNRPDASVVGSAEPEQLITTIHRVAPFGLAS